MVCSGLLTSLQRIYLIINSVNIQLYNIVVVHYCDMSYTWGPPIWSLFHTVIEHAHEAAFDKVGQTIFIFINRICRLLPCPECQEHAKKYLSNQRVNTGSKKVLREFIHKFHNMVNRYKKYNEPTIEILDQYREKNLIEVYNNFVKVFSSRGNIRMLADTMQRNMILKDFKTWLLINKETFYQPRRDTNINTDATPDTDDTNINTDATPDTDDTNINTDATPDTDDTNINTDATPDTDDTNISTDATGIPC
jgi:hypothetical protein